MTREPNYMGLLSKYRGLIARKTKEKMEFSKYSENLEKSKKWERYRMVREKSIDLYSKRLKFLSKVKHLIILIER
jgi:hypothetical protein